MLISNIDDEKYDILHNMCNAGFLGVKGLYSNAQIDRGIQTMFDQSYNGPVCAEKTSFTSLHHHYHHHYGSMLFALTSDPTICVSWLKSRFISPGDIVLSSASSFGQSVLNVASDFCSDRSRTLCRSPSTSLLTLFVKCG